MNPSSLATESEVDDVRKAVHNVIQASLEELSRMEVRNLQREERDQMVGRIRPQAMEVKKGKNVVTTREMQQPPIATKGTAQTLGRRPRTPKLLLKKPKEA